MGTYMRLGFRVRGVGTYIRLGWRVWIRVRGLVFP